MSTQTEPTKSNKKASNKKAIATETPMNQIERHNADLIAAGVLDEGEESEFGIINPDLHYYKMVDEQGNKHVLRGIVLERRERPDHDDSDGYYYVIALTRPLTLYTGEGEKIDAQIGDFAWVDERWALQALKGYLPVFASDNKGVRGMVDCCEVIITPGEKVQLKGGRSLWKAKIQARHISPEIPEGAGLKLMAPAGDPAPLASKESEIPF